jgi:hypothetical protein
MSDAKSPFHRREKEIQSRFGIQDQIEENGRRVIRGGWRGKRLSWTAVTTGR